MSVCVCVCVCVCVYVCVYARVYARARVRLFAICVAPCSGSHVLRLLVPKYPQVRFVCLDKVDYCASVKNMDDVVGCPNFKFVKGTSNVFIVATASRSTGFHHGMCVVL